MMTYARSSGIRQTACYGLLRCTFRLLLSLGVLAITTNAGVAQPRPHVGQIYDLDYIKGNDWVQVQARDSFVGISRNAAVILGCETAMQLKVDAELFAEMSTPHEIERIHFANPALSPSVPSGLHAVVWVGIEAASGTLRARFMNSGGSTTEGWSKDPRLISLVLTALREQWFLGYLAVDAGSDEITRAKINLEDQP